jgi:hypothetical protein
MSRLRRLRLVASIIGASLIFALPFGSAGRSLAAGVPPLAKSDNVTVLGNVPTGPAFGMNFKGHYAFVTGPTGLTVLDIVNPAAPAIVAAFPLPHFENEDVDLCGDLLLIANDRESRDLGAILYVLSIAVPTRPTLLAALPLGLTGQGRGAGHIANFVKPDCSQAWIDGGNLVEVIDLTVPAQPRSLGKFESVASRSDAFTVTHDTEADGTGILWSVGGGGAAGYRLTNDALNPQLVASTSPDGINPSPFNDFILHNSQRNGNVLLITEEDYIDTDETPPGGCRGQGKFETWSLADMRPEGITPLDTWSTELNGFLFGPGSEDSKAPVTVNCSSHWFDSRKHLTAVGWYEQGTRFLDVSNPRKIRQVGYYIPANGSTWAAYWSPTDPSHSIVYTADAYMGVDVLRIARPYRNSDMQTLVAPIPDVWWGDVRRFTYTPSARWTYFCPRLP